MNIAKILFLKMLGITFMCISQHTKMNLYIYCKKPKELEKYINYLSLRSHLTIITNT